MAAALAAQIAGGNCPDAILVGQTYDGRDIAGRLSVRIDRPLLTNIVGLEAGDGGLVTEHAIFGGTEVLYARFTGDAPGIFVVRAKSFAAEPTDAGPAAVDSVGAPRARRGRRGYRTGFHTSRRAKVRSSTRPPSWFPAGGASAKPTATR